jgi:phytol kinase
MPQPQPLSLNPWVALALELALLVGLMVGLRLFQLVRPLAPETSRKLYHISGGLTTLTFPWVFSSVWPVVLLAAITIPSLLAVKYIRALRGSVGAVLYRVERPSFGEVYFPLSVCLLFVLSKGDPLLFSIPILILALADTVAATIGVRYGQVKYKAMDGYKSAEGSAAFFIVAFLSVLVPLLVFTSTGGTQALVVAVILGLLVMMSEAIAWRGLDNLFIPLTSFFLLRTLLRLDMPALLLQLAVTVALSLIAYVWQRRTTLNGGAIMGAILGAYMIWTLGGWQWLFVPFVVFMSYTTLLHKTTFDRERLINIYAVFSVASAGILWLYLSRPLARPDFFYPFTIAFAAHLPIIGMVRHKYAVPTVSPARLLVTNIAKGWLVLAAAYVLFDGPTLAFALHSLAGLVGLTFAALAFYASQPNLGGYPTDWPRWRREALCAAVGSVAGLAPVVMLAALPAHVL